MNVVTYEQYWNKFITAGLVNSIYTIDLLDLDTATNDLRGGKYKPDHLVLESFTVQTDLVHADDIYDVFYGAVLVLAPAPIRALDQSVKTDILNSTYKKAATIKRAMISDKYNNCDWMKGLEVESIQIEKIGPVLNQQYGWRIQFRIDINITDPL
jgi:hypothetical protein